MAQSFSAKEGVPDNRPRPNSGKVSLKTPPENSACDQFGDPPQPAAPYNDGGYYQIIDASLLPYCSTFRDDP